MASPVLSSVVHQVLDLPADRLAAVIGAWPEPAILASGPGFGEAGRWSIFTAFPGWSSRPRIGAGPSGRIPGQAETGAGDPLRELGRLAGRFGLADPADTGGSRRLPVPGRADRLPRLRPGPLARTTAAEGAPRLAPARPPHGPLRHGRHRRSPLGAGRPPGLGPDRRRGIRRPSAGAAPGAGPCGTGSSLPGRSGPRGWGRSPATSAATPISNGFAGRSSTSRPATSSRSTSRSGSRPTGRLEPLDLFLRLKAGPAPRPSRRSSAGTTWRSSRASPEWFYQTRGDRVVTRPIKGTRPRGATPEEDRRLAAELAASAQGPGRADHDRGPGAERPGPGLPVRHGPGDRSAGGRDASPRSITWSRRSRAGSARRPARST